MSLKIYLLTGLIAIIVSVVFAFIDFKIALGIVLATAFSLFNLFLLAESMKKVINSDTPSYGLMVSGNMIRFGLLFVMLLVAYKFQNLFSMVGVAIGLTLFMFALVIDAISKRKGN